MKITDERSGKALKEAIYYGMSEKEKPRENAKKAFDSNFMKDYCKKYSGK